MKAVEWFRDGRKRVIRGKKIVIDLVKHAVKCTLRLVDVPATYGGFSLRLDNIGPSMRWLPDRRLEIIVAHSQVAELIDSIFKLADQQTLSAQGLNPFLRHCIREANKKYRIITTEVLSL